MGPTPGEFAPSFSFASNLTPAGVLELDHTGVIRAINSMAAKLLDFDPAAVVGTSLLEAVTASYSNFDEAAQSDAREVYGRFSLDAGTDSADVLRDHLKKAAQSESPTRCAMRIESADAGERHILFQTIRLSSTDRQSGFRIILTDLTELGRLLRFAEEARKRAERETLAKVESLARLSHEIRSGMASMIGFAEILTDEVADAQRELAEIIVLSGRHLLNTLNAMIDLSRLEYQRGRAKREEIDVVKKARMATERMRTTNKRDQLRIVFRADTPSATAELNETYLERILHNLIDNAIKYTPAGTVEVSVEEQEERVMIHVADTGIGIDRRFLSRLFKPFEREHRSVEADTVGVGLGLVVTRQLVEEMNGQITVCSTRGQGSTFTVSFPSQARELTAEEA